VHAALQEEPYPSAKEYADKIIVEHQAKMLRHSLGETLLIIAYSSASPTAAPTEVLQPCDASTPPQYASVGNCTAHLASGAVCRPLCFDGYQLSLPMSFCTGGRFTSATCTALPCRVKEPPKHGTLGDLRRRIPNFRPVPVHCGYVERRDLPRRAAVR
jgi:hypothetical protein